jgi:Arc/MetJ-type ribon-helix-helix transcriptional regulator
MIYYHDLMSQDNERRRKRVAEPLQVYLDPTQRRRLEQLSSELGLSKSDVVRLGLEELERRMTDPDQHPALRIIGIASAETSKAEDYDVARDHDRFLAESERKSWKTVRKARRGR